MPPPSVRTAFATTLLAAGAGAQARPLPHPLEASPAYAAAIADGRRTVEGRPGAAAWTDHARYVIDAELDPDLCLVRGHVAMTYRNRGPEALEELVVHLRQNLHAPSARRNIEVEVTGGMRIERLQIAAQEPPHWIDGTVLTVMLEEELPPGGERTLEMDFSFQVPNGEAPRMGREAREQFFLGYWYPQFAVRDDVDGWVAEQYLGQSEFYMPFADYEVAFTAPVGFLVQATGALQNPEAVLTPNARAALDRAATSEQAVTIVGAEDLAAGNATLADASGRLCWRFAATGVRDFAIGAANCQVWEAAAANVGDRDGDGEQDRCLVQTFHRPDARAYVRCVRYARHAIEWMSRHIAPYPWPHATVVEGILGGGMEYPMVTLCGDIEIPAALQTLVGHELAHMWFPMQVGSNETACAWLDEGLVEFLTDLIAASYWHRGPSAVRKAVEYATLAERGLDREPLLNHSDHLTDGGVYTFNGYTKPAAVLHQLAGLFDYPTVTAALANYAEDWRWRHPQPLDFFHDLNASLGHDLDWYWSCWWTETWRLDHAVAAVAATDTGDGTEVEVEDRGLAFAPTVVTATYGDGRTDEQTVPVSVWLRGERAATLSFGPGVVRVEIDAGRRTLDVDRDNNVWTGK